MEITRTFSEDNLSSLYPWYISSSTFCHSSPPLLHSPRSLSFGITLSLSHSLSLSLSLTHTHTHSFFQSQSLFLSISISFSLLSQSISFSLLLAATPSCRSCCRLHGNCPPPHFSFWIFFFLFIYEKVFFFFKVNLVVAPTAAVIEATTVPVSNSVTTVSGNYTFGFCWFF